MTKLYKDKPTLLLLITFLFLSCNTQTQIDLNGTWLITEMSFQGQPTYPNTSDRGINEILQGYEDHETLSFRIVDSTVVLPGFSSEKLTTDFDYRNNQLIIRRNDDKPELELTNLIFSGTYEVDYSKSENTLELISDETKINLINKDEVLRKNIDSLFK